MQFAKMARFPLYPIMLGVLPVLYYSALNRHVIEWFEVVRPILAALLVVAASISISYLIARKRDVAMLLSLVLFFLIFMFPIVFGLIADWISPEVELRHVLLVWCILGASAYILTLWKLGNLENLDRQNPFLNLFAATLCGVQLVIIIASMVNHSAADSSFAEVHEQWADDLVHQTEATVISPSTQGEYPDIYWLILDAYTRGDILKTRFDFDNDEFLDELRDAGFFVANQSHSNYPWTHLSVSSTLNCEYLHDLLGKDYAAGAKGDYRRRRMYVLSKLSKEYIQSSRIQRFLAKHGYEWHTTNTGYVTRKKEPSISEVFFGPTTTFEEMLLRRTALDTFVPDTTLFTVWRSQLTKFVELSNRPGPKFVLSHIISPHRPFCFDENGDEVARHPVYDASGWLEDVRMLPGYDDHYRENYPKNVAGLNIYAMQSINRLLANTKGEAIIIVQADHGSGLGFDPSDPAKTDMPQSFAILNAIYLPKKYSRDGLDHSISSVNTFRVVLSNVFGVELKKLDDRAWYSRGDLEFTEVTNKVRSENDTE